MHTSKQQTTSTNLRFSSVVIIGAAVLIASGIIIASIQYNRRTYTTDTTAPSVAQQHLDTVTYPESNSPVSTAEWRTYRADTCGVTFHLPPKTWHSPLSVAEIERMRAEFPNYVGEYPYWIVPRGVTSTALTIALGLEQNDYSQVVASYTEEDAASDLGTHVYVNCIPLTPEMVSQPQATLLYNLQQKAAAYNQDNDWFAGSQAPKKIEHIENGTSKKWNMDAVSEATVISTRSDGYIENMNTETIYVFVKNDTLYEVGFSLPQTDVELAEATSLIVNMLEFN